jgi:hypothetical protein
VKQLSSLEPDDGVELGTALTAAVHRPAARLPASNKIDRERIAAIAMPTPQLLPLLPETLNPDAETPRTGIVDRDSGPRGLFPMESIPTRGRRARGLPRVLYTIMQAA